MVNTLKRAWSSMGLRALIGIAFSVLAGSMLVRAFANRRATRPPLVLWRQGAEEVEPRSEEARLAA
jgi:hypothetical protein